MKKGILLIVLIFAALQPSLAMGVLVEISVETDKPSYSLSEPPTISVIAYNPNNYQVTLNYGTTYQANHIIDGIYQWSSGFGLTIPTWVDIEPLSSHTWSQAWSQDRYSEMTLGVGTHTVVGWTARTIGLTGEEFYSSQITFEVVPEPATLLLLGLGGLMLRKRRAE